MINGSAFDISARTPPQSRDGGRLEEALVPGQAFE